MPTRFVLCAGDRFFPPEFMRRVVAGRLGIVPDEIAAGHAVALSRPRELAGFARQLRSHQRMKPPKRGDTDRQLLPCRRAIWRLR